ncbi:paraquat-inducible protein A [Bowmanella yangjiangensis]|nr:paraquat-inducible protein A [Bowmanella yangjiangensis]
MLRQLSLGMNLLALGLFVPGIWLPMFALKSEMGAWFGQGRLTADLVDKELSILQTVEELWRDDRLLVAALIFFFSVAIPVIKTLLVSLAWYWHKLGKGRKLADWIAAIGKWSMADVFVVAIFLAVLSTDHAETTATQAINLFGLRIDFEISSATLSTLGPGFYYFVGYCILSLAASQLLHFSLRRQPAADQM